MERLSDIVDQQPELQKDLSVQQIALPPIKGDVEFENLSFRFKSSGPYQLNNVCVKVPASSFVGIVGKSGSGKSTLMYFLAFIIQNQVVFL